eukprot:TRINITY_DN6595_c0_g1_i2.p1 TRINITY_DN6595_c0_g1~~TRINITY_DN6595_c0_g1_i2.p1  ORF type:complete len:341 (-),score=54.41 TRINITY_DN6595_c0_g1_i2:59-1081(-)
MMDKPANFKSASVKTPIFLILAMLVKRYKQGAGVRTLLMESLHKSEHIALPLAEFMYFVATDSKYDASFFFVLFLQDINELDQSELATNGESSKNIGAFLLAAAEKLPTLMWANLHYLVSQLDGESYTIRNAVISAIGQTFLLKNAPKPEPYRLEAEGSASEDDTENFDVSDDVEADDERLSRRRALRKKSKSVHEVLERDQLYKILEAHFNDVSSYTRAKLLQTFCTIVEERALPVHLQGSLRKHAVTRLMDRAVQVRKKAVQLLTAMLQYNPYGPSLNLMQFERQWKEIGPTENLQQTSEPHNLLNESDDSDMEIDSDSQHSKKKQQQHRVHSDDEQR